MKSYKVIDLLEEVMSGEWGQEPDGENDVKVLRTTNFTNEGRLDLSKEIVTRSIEKKKVEKKKLQYGDIIIEKSGGSPDQPVGRVVYFDIEDNDIYLCNNFTSILRPNSKKVENKYLLYFLYYQHKIRKVLKYQNKTTGIINLKLDNYLNKTDIVLPPRKIQQRVVELLDKSYELIEKRKSQIEALDQLTQSVFLEMFGDPVLNTKGWKKKKFDYFAKIDTVMIKDFTNYKNSPHIGIENIEKNTGRIINYQTVAKSNITSGKYLFTDKHIIYSKIRPYLNKVALPNFTGVCSADAYPILVHEGKISRYFFAYLLRSNAFLNHVSKNSERTNIPKVNKQQLLSFTGICPPFKLQLEFEEICIKIESYRKIFEKSLKELENNFNSLMQRVFKGELFIEEKVSNL